MEFNLNLNIYLITFSHFFRILHMFMFCVSFEIYLLTKKEKTLFFFRKVMLIPYVIVWKLMLFDNSYTHVHVLVSFK